ncbi:hypothetical protein G6O67_000837 [Ophiocordyceps sinensis]|uniref:Gamma interferon inducible lysosomal thiol reductase GILT n=1 Tax=Ophiocordyceps sinensis TaxID=72228 RepID=A0A8H4Q005_9HYPO|nr:hypothetical protein G6O67_000837 [Ophiocordyceps sinensis]
MDDKAKSYSNIRQQNLAMPPRSRPVVRLLLLLVFIVAVGFYTVPRPLSWRPSFASGTTGTGTTGTGTGTTGTPVANRGAVKKPGLVPLEAHVISKCPDTRDALRQLILPVMQRVHDKVDFKLNFIGTPTANDGVECKHGPSECLGNIIELCARELYPEPKINLGFIMCLTKDYKDIPNRALIEDCALEHAIDFKALNECATRDDGAHGLELLRNSVQRTADVNTAPTGRASTT